VTSELERRIKKIKQEKSLTVFSDVLLTHWYGILYRGILSIKLRTLVIMGHVERPDLKDLFTFSQCTDVQTGDSNGCPPDQELGRVNQ
jgi:hypothetical protein